MIRPEFRKKLERQHTILLLVWAAFVNAVFLYVWMANFLPSRSSPSSLSETFRITLWLISLSMIGVLLWWRKRFLTKEAIFTPPAKVPMAILLQGYESPVEERSTEVITFYFTMTVATFALAETAALLGFVLAFLGGYRLDQYVLSLLSAILLLLQFPSKSFLEELIKDVEARGG